MAEDSSGRQSQTVADYVTLVLSPVLIMGLVGSLVFFLLEVFYKTDGQWKERLQWILFFFVFGEVLAARLSMGEHADRAPLYAGVLALLTYLGMQSFVEYPAAVKELSFFVNILLVGVVWWCAHRLTWDCTNIDEDADMSGEGLLQAAGLEEAGAPLEEEPAETAKDAKPLSWWQRFRQYREQKQKKRTLGVWVVYFSLAALPLFGLGQAFIPLTAPDRRRFAFWVMTVYVGCGLGLLLTTCFLGLRRYLRQKRLRMPPAMTGMWLTVGGTLIVLLLAAGALLPRPYAEYPLIDILDPAGSAKRQANRAAAKGDSPGEGKGQAGKANPDGKGPNDPENKGRGQGEKDGEDKGASKDGKDKAEGEKDGKSGGQGDKSGKDGSGGRGRERDPGKAGKAVKETNQRDGSQPPSSRSSPSSVQQIVQRVAPILKWLVFAALALIVLLALLRGGVGFLSNFTDWAKRLLAAWNNFWANLFGGKEAEKTGGDENVIEAVAVKAPKPFSDFANPFASGKAARMSARELVRYTFAALEAWAHEHDLGRREDETAMEFVQRLAEEVPALESEGQRLANLHARAEYAREALPANTVEVVRAFWQRLERVVEAPLSA